MSELAELRKELKKRHIRYITDWIFDVPLHRDDYDYECLYWYDRKKQKGLIQVPFPDLWTPEGRVMLERLLEAYEEENSPPKPPHYPGWTCTCGRENQHYVSTCVCGKSKHDN